MKLISKIIGFLYILSCSFANASASENTQDVLTPDQDPYFNYVFGVSPFLGILGLEYQSGHHSFGVGLPGHFSYRYYFEPFKDTKFVGAYLGRYSIDSYNDYEEGIFFRERESSFFGVGAGKRWQWPTGWNFSLSLAIEYFDDDFSNPSSSSTANKTGISLFPGINGGYKF